MATILEHVSPDFDKVTKTNWASITPKTYDYEAGDVGNIVGLDHINFVIPDQQAGIAFFVLGLGFTRDPYLRVGLDNMGINIGRNQLHVNTANNKLPVQRVRGTIGFVVPDLEILAKRLEHIARFLGDAFSYKVHADHVDANWAGNRVRCHAPSPEFGHTQLAIAYVDFEVSRGAAAGIARFYREGLQAATKEMQLGGDAVACVTYGEQKFLFHETDAPITPYDGHHVAIFLTNHSAPYRFLKKHDVPVIEDHAAQYRFRDIIDPKTGEKLFMLEHEVRSLRHVRYGETFVNRNPAQPAKNISRGPGGPGEHDSFHGSY